MSRHSSTYPQRFTAPEREQLDSIRVAIRRDISRRVEMLIDRNGDAIFHLARPGGEGLPLVCVGVAQATADGLMTFPVFAPGRPAKEGFRKDIRASLVLLRPAIVRIARMTFRGLPLKDRQVSLVVNSSRPLQARTPEGEPATPRAARRFGPADRPVLNSLLADARKRTRRKIALHTCDEAGDEWAALCLDDESPEGPELLVTIQTTWLRGDPAFVLLGPNGRVSPRADVSVDLQGLVPTAARIAAASVRWTVPEMRRRSLVCASWLHR